MAAIDWCLKQHSPIAAALCGPVEDVLEGLRPVDVPAPPAGRQSDAGARAAGSVPADSGKPMHTESARRTGRQLARLLQSAGYRLPDCAAGGDAAAGRPPLSGTDDGVLRLPQERADRQQQAQDLSRLFERDARRYGR